MGRWSQSRRVGSPGGSISSPSVNLGILDWSIIDGFATLSWTCDADPDRIEVVMFNGAGANSPTYSMPYAGDFTFVHNIQFGDGTARLASADIGDFADPDSMYAAIRFWQGQVASPWAYSGNIANPP